MSKANQQPILGSFKLWIAIYLFALANLLVCCIIQIVEPQSYGWHLLLAGLAMWCVGFVVLLRD